MGGCYQNEEKEKQQIEGGVWSDATPRRGGGGGGQLRWSTTSSLDGEEENERERERGYEMQCKKEKKYFSYKLFLHY